MAVPIAPSAGTYQRPVTRKVPSADETKPEVSEEEADVAAALVGEDEADAGEGDDSLIEEVEEEEPDVTGIIDAPIEPDDKA